MHASSPRTTLLAAALSVATATVALAGDVPVRNLSEVLTPELKQSIHHTVEQVDIDAGFYRFVVDSELGTYLAGSMEELRLRVEEIAVLSQAMNQFSSGSEELSEELHGQFSIRADSALDILTRPVSSASDLAGQLGDDINQTLTGSPVVISQHQQIDFASRDSSDPTLAMHRRNIAAQWGLDAYSSNPHVQAFLDTVAGARAGGRISAGAPGFFRSGAHRRNVADDKVDAGVAAALKSYSAADLALDTSGRLAGMQIPAGVVQRFMSHPVFTPRHRARIAAYLEALKGVRNRSAFLEVAMNAARESDALASEQAAMMLLHYHRNGTPIQQLSASNGLLTAVLSDRRLLYVIPRDILYWDGDLRDRLVDSMNQTRGSGFSGRELILAGEVTEAAAAELGLHGVKIHSGYVR